MQTKHVERVLYVPQLNCKMIIMSTLGRKGFFVQFGNGRCKVTKEDKLYAEACQVNGVYETHISAENANAAKMHQKTEADSELWCRRSGHRDTRTIMELKCNNDKGKPKCTDKIKCVNWITEKSIKPYALKRGAPGCWI